MTCVCRHARLITLPVTIPGNSDMVKRIVRRSPLRAARITWGFITKAYTRSAASAKDLFFSDDIPAVDVARYAGYPPTSQDQFLR